MILTSGRSRWLGCLFSFSSLYLSHVVLATPLPLIYDSGIVLATRSPFLDPRVPFLLFEISTRDGASGGEISQPEHAI